MKTIVVANQKGGTGKSTLAVHLGIYLADFLEKNYKVAFINCETQSNSSNTLKKKYSVGNVRANAFFSKELFPVEVGEESITVYEGGSFLADVERNQGGYFKQHIARLSEVFDYCVIDVPPTASVLQIAPLSAADYVISPIEMEDYSMQGVTDMIKTVIGVRKQYNPNMQFLGMLPNRLKGTSPRQKAALVDLLTRYPQFCFAASEGAKVGERQSIPEALSEGLPVWKLKKSSAKEASDEMLKVMNLIALAVGA